MSQKASGFDRIPGDRYFTPAWVTEALLTVERFPGPILDPCAGDGGILDALGTVDCHGADIESPSVPRADIVIRDFFANDPIPAFASIITNPPYGSRGTLAVAFIRRSLQLTKPVFGKVAMLLRVDFDSAKNRREIFGDHPAFAGKYTLTQRIRWVNLPQSDSGPTDNHAWFVWDWRRADAGRVYGYLPRKAP